MWLSPQSATHKNTNNSTYRSSALAQQQQALASALYTATDADARLDIDSEIQSQSALSSPQSTSDSFPLSTFDTLPANTVPRVVSDEYLNLATAPTQPQITNNMMYAADPWMGEVPFVTKRNMHNRDSSMSSSLSSISPASPFSFNTANPQIAVSDVTDNYQGMSMMQDDQSYQLATNKFPGTISHDTFYSSLPYSTTNQTFPQILAPQRQRSDRTGLLPPPDLSSGASSNSRPASVASSVASDSPATPAAPEHEEDRRRKAALPTVPKLDRTMTDIYSDELFNPNFAAITPTSTAQPSQTSLSPSHEMFAQRVRAANNQHLSANQSQSNRPRDHSPFTTTSNLAPPTTQSFNNQSNTGLRYDSYTRDARDADALAQSTSTGTPQTISPKDAMLDISDTDSTFPLFPQQQGGSGAGNGMNPLSINTTFSDEIFSTPLISGVRVPQQYPFVSQPKPQNGLAASINGSFSGASRACSGASVTPDPASCDTPRRPDNMRADGGTYTCTYHGCTQRFDTPALLQKHKREGHRSAHGLNGLRRPEGPAANYLNTQAGPHRCERINPSTGKPCNTIFSRPYDLTRHEDTIHNARKTKVRCDVCTEEKTFSRADALTRHYRVCHPDLEFPGKHRKRGPSGN